MKINLYSFFQECFCREQVRLCVGSNSCGLPFRNCLPTQMTSTLGLFSCIFQLLWTAFPTQRDDVDFVPFSLLLLEIIKSMQFISVTFLGMVFWFYMQWQISRCTWLVGTNFVGIYYVVMNSLDVYFHVTNSWGNTITRPLHKNLILEFPKMQGRFMLHLDR